ncbi:hypothetical protein ACLB2K_018093 [Fragaria x ananassa]
MAFRKGSNSSQSRQKQQVDKGSSTSDSDSSDHVSESLSDIDDAEVSPYLLSKEEALYKTILWEAMNKDYVERRSTRKRGRKAEEAAPRRKAAKTSTKSTDNTKKSSEGESNLAPGVKTGRSSKINYSVLDEEDYRFEEGLESNEKVISAEHNEEAEDGEGYGDDYEFEHENQYNEEDESYYANDDDNGHDDAWF